MKKQVLHTTLIFVFIFPLLFQPLHLFIHHFGNEIVYHHYRTACSIFNYHSKCPICHYETWYHVYIKTAERDLSECFFAENIQYKYDYLFISKLTSSKTSRAPPV